MNPDKFFKGWFIFVALLAVASLVGGFVLLWKLIEAIAG